MAIHDDDPLGSLMGGKGGLPKGGDEDEGPDDEEAGGHAAAGALIDAIHSKDAAAVYDAMKGMSAFMKPAGEDDMEMAPDSAEGALIPSGEG